MQWIVGLILTLFLSGCAIKNDYSPKTYESILPKLTLQAPILPKSNPKNFLLYYFKPWNSGLHVNKDQALLPWNVYKPEKKYYSETLQLRPKSWFDSQLNNANFEKLASLNQNAIILRATDVRNFPTHLPIFKDPQLAGEGFPFDYNQNSRIGPFAPVWLSHYSKDKMWAFIEADSFFGWVEASSVLPLNNELQEKFQNAPKIIALRPFALTHPSGIYTTVPTGTLLPLDDKGEIMGFLPQNKTIQLPFETNATTPWPIAVNKSYLDLLNKSFLDEPYGWGGMFGHRDCSALTKDFLAPFGIWLPRNSKAQFNHGSKIILKGLSPKEKEEMIQQYAIPFLSLVYLPGHIMLYGGIFEDKSLVLHNTWGIKTISQGLEGRYIIGKTIFSDLHVGSDHPKIDTSAKLISRVEGISTPNELSPKERLMIAYPQAIKEIFENRVEFYNGTTLPFSSNQTYTFENFLDNIDIQGQFIQPYPTLTPITEPLSDPGRFRNEDFFKALYGSSQEEIESQLVSINWLPNHTNKTLLFHSKHGAADALRRVSSELDKLPSHLLTFVDNPAGTYNYRAIARTSRLSMHSFGIAIDINTKKGDYWLWSKTKMYQNRIPEEIVHIFESNGFIWGGRWRHFDTFHFEYRPELTLP